MRWQLLWVALLAVQPAAARMYQWTDPETGTTYLSGTPPTWYRAEGGSGPRVLVFDSGKLVDDTDRAASQDEKDALREQALKELAARREESRARAQPEPQVEVPPEPGLEQAGGEDAVAGFFRSLIKEWERRRVEPGAPAPQATP